MPSCRCGAGTVGPVNGESRSIFSDGRLPLSVSILTIMGLIAFSILAVIAALPQITADLGDVELLSWVVTAFLLTSTIGTLAAGPIIDGLGVRATFRVAVTFFLAGTAACAAAPTMMSLIFFRAVQGAGGGLLAAVIFTAIGLAYPENLRARALAASSVVWGTMAIGAPAVAALFVTTTGWRGVFLVLLPIGLAAGALGWNHLPRRAEGAPERIDFDATGIVLLAVLTTVSLIGFSGFSWRSAAALLAAGILASVYWVYSGRAANPVMARRYFAAMPLGLISFVSAAGFGAAIGLDAFLPMYVRGGLGRSAALAAFSVAFLTFGWSSAAIVVSRLLDRIAASSLALFAYALLISALTLGLLVYSTTTPIVLVIAIAYVLGVGVGTLSISMLSLLQSEANPAEMGRASAAHQYVRGLTHLYGTAMVGTILLHVVRNRIGDMDAVQRLLAGEELAAAADAASGIAAGFRLGHIAALVLCVMGLVAAVPPHRHLARRTEIRTAELSSDP